jgi:acetyl-CoA carboxylase biotin carboxyl carrier protein
VTADRSVDWAPVLEATSRTAASLAANLGGAALQRIRVQSGDTCVELTWSPTPEQLHAAAPDTASDGEAPGEAVTASAHYLCSPMVGVFYQAPTPRAQPFVTVGDVVELGQQVGIIEAMKFLNRVEATEAGRVLEILVPNCEPVEYGTPLLALAPL